MLDEDLGGLDDCAGKTFGRKVEQAVDSNEVVPVVQSKWTRMGWVFVLLDLDQGDKCAVGGDSWLPY